jgi:ornithine--oxo-acid transaminase
MAVFQPGDHGSTFGGNPLGAAVGEAALELLVREDLPARAQALGAHLMLRLATLAHPAVIDVRGKGLFVGVEIDPAFASARRVCEALIGEGVLTKDTHGTVIRLAPALTIEAEQLDFAVDALRRALERVEAAQAVAA